MLPETAAPMTSDAWTPDLKAPLPYFGGKSAVAKYVWAALGQPKHYIEPFCGSCAVLLLRPDYIQGQHIETVNDADCHIANLWRALQFAPDETAKWCDWPVNHVDLMVRKAFINEHAAALRRRLMRGPRRCDPVMAGYYIWAASCWIGSGLTCPGQRPHVGDGGTGVHALGKRPNVSNGETEITAPYNTNIYLWFRRLSERLRYVRVVCGEWKRVCGGDWQDKMGDVGIFFDPPYAHDVGRHEGLYAEESENVSREAAAWAIERGSRKSYRIVFAGYADEHPALIEAGWRVMPWKAQGGYGNRGGEDSRGSANRHREALFFSPFTLKKDVANGLF